MSLIEVQGVSKTFRRHTGRRLLREQLREWFFPNMGDVFYALRDVSIRIGHREGVAIIGANGAGKSTLLSLISGLAKPDQGSVRVNGRIAPMLELGSGFHPDLTGSENILINAALLGFTEREVLDRFDEIIDFSEIGEFIQEPVRTYSSGMILRLAFAVAVHVNPDILIVDEVLGVGDSHFQEKCSRKISSLRQEGKTLLCVSHSPAAVLEFCERAVWLHHGQVILDGEARAVLNAYLEHSANPEAPLPAQATIPAVT